MAPDSLSCGFLLGFLLAATASAPDQCAVHLGHGLEAALVERPCFAHDPVRDELAPLRQPSGKRLTVWAAEAVLDPDDVVPGTFTMEWPPRSGKTAEFPKDVVRTGFTTETTLRRTDFGMRTLVGPVGDEVVVYICLEGIKKK